MQLSHCGIQACCYFGLSALLFLQNGALVLYADTSVFSKGLLVVFVCVQYHVF